MINRFTTQAISLHARVNSEIVSLSLSWGGVYKRVFVTVDGYAFNMQQ